MGKEGENTGKNGGILFHRPLYVPATQARKIPIRKIQTRKISDNTESITPTQEGCTQDFSKEGFTLSK